MACIVLACRVDITLNMILPSIYKCFKTTSSFIVKLLLLNGESPYCIIENLRYKRDYGQLLISIYIIKLNASFA